MPTVNATNIGKRLAPNLHTQTIPSYCLPINLASLYSICCFHCSSVIPCNPVNSCSLPTRLTRSVGLSRRLALLVLSQSRVFQCGHWPIPRRCKRVPIINPSSFVWSLSNENCCLTGKICARTHNRYSSPFGLSFAALPRIPSLALVRLPYSCVPLAHVGSCYVR